MTINVCRKKFEHNAEISFKILGNIFVLGCIVGIIYGSINNNGGVIIMSSLFGGVTSLMWCLNDFNSFWLGYLQNKFKLFAWRNDC